MENEKYFAFYLNIKFIFTFLFSTFCVSFTAFPANCITYRHFTDLHRFLFCKINLYFLHFSSFQRVFFRLRTVVKSLQKVQLFHFLTLFNLQISIFASEDSSSFLIFLSFHLPKLCNCHKAVRLKTERRTPLEPDGSSRYNKSKKVAGIPQKEACAI